MKDLTNKTDRVKMMERALLILMLDIIVVLAASFVSLWLRYDFRISGIERMYLVNLYRYAPINIACTIMIFYIFRLYTSLWKYASVSELSNVIFAVGTSSLLQYVGMHALGFEDAEKLLDYLFPVLTGSDGGNPILLQICKILPEYIESEEDR